MLYGLERFPFGEIEVYEGEKNLEELWEKLSTGKYVINAVPVDDNNKVQTEWVKHHVGDKITLVMENGGYVFFLCRTVYHTAGAFDGI